MWLAANTDLQKLERALRKMMRWALTRGWLKWREVTSARAPPLTWPRRPLLGPLASVCAHAKLLLCLSPALPLTTAPPVPHPRERRATRHRLLDGQQNPRREPRRAAAALVPRVEGAHCVHPSHPHLGAGSLLSPHASRRDTAEPPLPMLFQQFHSLSHALISLNIPPVYKRHCLTSHSHRTVQCMHHPIPTPTYLQEKNKLAIRMEVIEQCKANAIRLYMNRQRLKALQVAWTTFDVGCGRSAAAAVVAVAARFVPAAAFLRLARRPRTA